MLHQATCNQQPLCSAGMVHADAVLCAQWHAAFCKGKAVLLAPDIAFVLLWVAMQGPPPPSFCSMGPAGGGGQPAAQTGFSAFPLSWIWGSHSSGRK
jgi:hypothetical protein